jgi:AcrR family transcriptional regulator
VLHGTVYRHFPTRNALFEAVIADRVEKLTERARRLSAAGTAPDEAFRGYFADLVGEVALNQALCEALDNGDGTSREGSADEQARRVSRPPRAGR